MLQTYGLLNNQRAGVTNTRIPLENKNESYYHFADHDLLRSNGPENDQG